MSEQIVVAPRGWKVVLIDSGEDSGMATAVSADVDGRQLWPARTGHDPTVTTTEEAASAFAAGWNMRIRHGLVIPVPHGANVKFQLPGMNHPMVAEARHNSGGREPTEITLWENGPRVMFFPAETSYFRTARGQSLLPHINDWFSVIVSDWDAETAKALAIVEKDKVAITDARTQKWRSWINRATLTVAPVLATTFAVTFLVFLIKDGPKVLGDIGGTLALSMGVAVAAAKLANAWERRGPTPPDRDREP